MCTVDSTESSKFSMKYRQSSTYFSISKVTFKFNTSKECPLKLCGSLGTNKTLQTLEMNFPYNQRLNLKEYVKQAYGQTDESVVLK